MRFAPLLFIALWSGAALAQDAAEAPRIFPINRAQILSGEIFDFKVELPVGADPAKTVITVNGRSLAQTFGAEPARKIEEAQPGVGAASLWLRDVKLSEPGAYTVTASDGNRTSTVIWEVYGTGSKRVAKNVILMIGDGMTIANRTAARILSKGVVEGRYKGRLAMDDLPYTAMLGTSSVDSIVTDSANSASAYTTGHKSSVNALGVYADRQRNPFYQPKVELISEVAKRKRNMAVGVITDAEVEDATPASMLVHTRRRAEKAFVATSALEHKPEVLMGGGSAYFLPQSTPGSKRKDDIDLIDRFRKENYKLATTASEMKAAAADPSTRRLLGLYHPENMDGSLDRHYLKGGTVKDFPEQPDLPDMAQAALDVLSRDKNGFLLMIEAGLIDKFTHPLDWERSVYDTIMLDRTVALVKAWAEKRGDTLVIVTPDHAHALSLIGTIDDDRPGTEMREKVGTYADAGFPNYPPADANGYPPEVNVSRRLFMTIGDYPDHYETWRPKLDGPNVPTIGTKDADGKTIYVANPAYKDVPGAVLVQGNLPRKEAVGVHAVDDVILSAMGPGAERFHGFMENTEVFKVMATALALGDK